MAVAKTSTPSANMAISTMQGVKNQNSMNSRSNADYF
jgi:hypothetical protein